MNRFTLQLEEIKAAYAAEPNPSLEVRLERIGRIEKMLIANEDKICKALMADFGIRHPLETQIAELRMVYQTCRHTRKHLKEWMKPSAVDTPWFMGNSQAWVERQSIGVVGIMSPWNYPIQLALIPAIAALAAGNRIWLKPSERSLRTSGFLAGLIQEYFHPTEFCVTTGGPELAETFAALPFDHLFFTGSTEIGKKVMRAAADHLTPVTLELGGKSPAIIDASANLKEAAESIVYGKLLNGGQTCIAPDYVLIAPERRHDFIQELQTAALAQFSNPSELTGPIDKLQVNRWQVLLADATKRGATAIPLLNRDPHREFEPHILLDVPEDALVLHEEIFGPLLPIIAIADTAEAIHFINRQPNPLALYWFGKNKQNLRLVLDQTRSGGVCINETVLQATIEDLPFGGIGASGLGAYHGKAGFDALSHQKSILQVRGLLGLNILRGTSLARPPYGKGILRLLRWIK